MTYMGAYGIQNILKLIRYKDEHTFAHMERVSLLTRWFGSKLGLSDEMLENLALAGKYHDIGKINVPEKILKKREGHTEAEFEIIKKHCQTGHEILKRYAVFDEISLAVLYHHEKYDGSGYPEGLSGEDIPFEARIISITDAYDIMTSDRFDQSKLSIQDALNEIEKNMKSQFDPDLARQFRKNVEWKIEGLTL